LQVDGGPTPVPEPATLAGFGLGLAALAGYAWRKRRAEPPPPPAAPPPRQPPQPRRHPPPPRARPGAGGPPPPPPPPAPPPAHPVVGQALPPAVEALRPDAQGEVPRPRRPVRRQDVALEGRRGVEHQQHARRADLEEDVPAGLAPDHLQAEHAGVERLRRLQV